MTPEQRTRQKIDLLLQQCDWIVQDRSQRNLAAGPGVAIREALLKGGEADYRKRQTNTGLTARRISRLDPSRPSFGREFSDAIAGKIGQPREHRAEVVAE